MARPHAADRNQLDETILASSDHPQLKRAAEAQQQRRSAEAAAIVSEYLADKPDDPLALVMLAEALIGVRRLADAEQVVRPVLAKWPSFTRARVALGSSLMLQCRQREAVDLFDAWARDHPDDAPAWQFLAQVLADSGRFTDAAAAYEHLLDLQERDPDAWLEYAIALRFAGRKDDAQVALRRALAIDPRYGALWWTLCNMAPEAITAGDLAAMRDSLARAEYVDDASQLHVAIATMLDRAGDYEQAFDHFATGKALRARVSAYRPEDLTAHVDQAMGCFDASSHARRAGWGTPASAPIFIIGMPRSGSTLIERMLGRSTRIEATGELPIVPRLVDELDAEAGGPGRHLELLAKAGSDRVEELGALYLRRSSEFRRTDKPCFTDKLHMNWRHLGLIRSILPNARIIDVRRNPIECCWSNFRTLFASGHPASDDLQWVGHFYREYVRFTDHIAGSARNNLLTVRYEQVVADFETEARRIFAFLGLEFQPHCLDFHLLDAPVATASAEQVRRPLNREGLGRAQPYRRWLGPLIEALGPLAADDG